MAEQMVKVLTKEEKIERELDHVKYFDEEISKAYEKYDENKDDYSVYSFYSNNLINLFKGKHKALKNLKKLDKKNFGEV